MRRRGVGIALVAPALLLLWVAAPSLAGVAAPDPVPIPEPSPEAVRYNQTGLVLWFVGRAWSFVAPGLILLTGWSARIGRLAEGDGKGRGRPLVVAVALYLAIFLALEFLINLPLRYYAGFVRPHAYGLSTQSFARWLGDAAKRLGVEVVAGALFAWVPFWLMRRSPTRWWLYTGLLILPFSAFSALVVPVAVDPLFNDFGPMRDARVEAKILALADRAGIRGGRVFEVDKSRDTTTVNAYVTGLGGTKRIVLWDTIVAKLDEDELLVVMGHEMGHYVLNHVALGIVLASLATLVGLGVVHVAARALVARHAVRFGFDRVDRVAAVPLLMILVQAMVLVTSPATNAASRWMEREADRFALELTRDNHAAATGFAKLQRDNLAVPFPDPFTLVWRSTHPSIGARIDFCNSYRPWATGQPLRYGDRFRAP